MLRVGLTGGIACGKSLVLRRLAERGCRTLDLDAVARAVTAPGSEALAEIRAAFGGSVLDASGALDRPALGALVFHDAAARQRLNRIVHPRVRAAEAGWAAGFARGASGAVLVTDGALLIEGGVHLRFDRLVVVHCAPELQLRRLRARDGLDEGAARARIEAQLPSATKLAFAHFDVDTSGALADTERAADALGETLAALARGSRGPVPDGVLERFAGGLSHGSDDGPRGLAPTLLLRVAASAGGLEMDALAQLLTPPAAGPWYRAAEEGPAVLPAARLGVAVAAWACARNGNDPDYAAAAAASVARLTHGDDGERTDACLVALDALARAAAPDEERPALPGPRTLALASRFGGAEAGGRLGAVWTALEQAPADPGRAGALCIELGGDAPTAAALAGLRVEAAAESREPWRTALRAIRGTR